MKIVLKEDNYIFIDTDIELDSARAALDSLKDDLINYLGPDVWIRKSPRDYIPNNPEEYLSLCLYHTKSDPKKVLFRVNTEASLKCDLWITDNKKNLEIIELGSLFASRPNQFTKESFEIFNISPLSLIALEAENYQWDYYNS